MVNDRKAAEKLIATNPNAYSNFFIEEVIEAGMVLMGTEVKSLRSQSPNLRDAFVDVVQKAPRIEAWLVNVHMAPYTHGNIWNHEPLRRRKLLLHSHQLSKLFGAVTQKGCTLVPTKMYFKGGRVKIEIGLGKGKKKHDRRADMKKREVEREVAQAQRRKR